MRMLAIDAATPACSVALFDGGDLVAHDWRELGRGHAEALVPMIAALPDKGRADAIRVGLGPGSFTGTRIGLAAARALGIAWGAKVQGFPTHALVAATALSHHAGPLTVCMAGGHGEWFVQHFDDSGMPEGEAQSLAPELAMTRGAHSHIVGNRGPELAASQPGGGHRGCVLLPDTRYALALPDMLLTTQLAPIYGRAPDAKLPQ